MGNEMNTVTSMTTDNITDNTTGTTEKMSEQVTEIKISEADYSAWMNQMKESNDIQARYAKKQSRMAGLSAFFTFIILVVVIAIAVILVPPALATLEQANSTLAELENVASELEVVTTDLAKADISGMLNNVNGLVVSSQQDLSEAMKKIDALDINTLNAAIKDLYSVVKPMANFMRPFG